MPRAAYKPSRRSAVGGIAATAGAALVLAGARAETLSAPAATLPHADTVRSILDTALAVEQLSTTFYYTALTTAAILRTRQLCGGSSDANNPGLPPNGNPHRVRCLQAALDAEARHADVLTAAGARPRVTSFYFPATTFTRLGTSFHPNSLLGVLDQLETLSIGLYLVAVERLARLGRLDLAQLAAELAGVEAEHRMLGRVLADIKPANNLTLEKEPFASVGEAQAALRPFLDGKGFAGGPTAPMARPSRSHVAHVVGKYGTRRVLRFL